MTSPFLDMRLDYPQTSLWTRSADPMQLIESIGWGVTGAAPSHHDVASALAGAPDRFAERLERLTSLYPTASEPALAGLVTEDLLLDVAAALAPTFEKYSGRDGRICLPTDPTRLRDPDALIEQATATGALAANTLAAIPATAAGLHAIAEATRLGVSVCAVDCMSLAQALAAADAIEQGLAKRAVTGRETKRMAPMVCVPLGALDEALATDAADKQLLLEPGLCQYAGVALFKEAYRIFAERGYGARLLAVDAHGIQHLAEVLGGDVAIALSHAFQERVTAAEPVLRERIGHPLPADRIAELARQLPAFDQAMQVDGLTVSEFDSFPPMRAQLRRHHDEFAALIGQVVAALYPIG